MRRAAPHLNPPAMRVELTGFTKPPSRRTLAIVQAARVPRRKGGEAYGREGLQPVAHEVDVQVPHRVHAEV